MKKFLPLILAGFLSAGAVEALAISNQINPIHMETCDNPPTGNAVVELRGDLDYGAGQNSIEAFVSKNSVQVYFHRNFGNVNIMIMSENGSVVYNNTVNTAVQQTFYIPLSNTLSGNYTLILDNTNGGCEGDFEK